MLDQLGESSPLVELLDKFPCPVELPATWSDFYGASGPLCTRFDDRRQFPRYHFRGRAMMQIGDENFCVLTKDISRGGICLVHYAQLLPLVRGRILLTLGVRTSFEVRRCQRIGGKCYEVGARFLDPDDCATIARRLAEGQIA